MKKFASRLYNTGLIVFLMAMAMLGGGIQQAAGMPSVDYSTTVGSNEYFISPPEQGTEISEAANIEPTMVLDEENLKITLQSIDYSSGPFVIINYEVQNLYDQRVTVQTREFSINGYMIEASCSSDVRAGETLQDVMYIDRDELALAGIGEIVDMQMIFKAFESSTYNDIYISDYVYIGTDGTYQQTYDDSGIVLYDENNVKVVMKPLDFSNSVEGPRIPLYIENNNNISLTCSTSDLKINGFLIDEFFIRDISPGKRLVAYIDYFETPKSQYGIEEFEDIEFEMFFLSMDNIDTFFTTGSLYVDLKEN